MYKAIRERISAVYIFDQSGYEPAYSVKNGGEFNVWNNMGFLAYFQHSQSNGNWEVVVESKNYQNTPILLLLICIPIYWTLFTIWAIVNAYHHRRLNVVWIFVFALFNFVGYFAYRLIGNRQLYVSKILNWRLIK